MKPFSIILLGTLLSTITQPGFTQDNSSDYWRLRSDAARASQRGNYAAAQDFLQQAKIVLDNTANPKPQNQEAINFDLAEIAITRADAVSTTVQKAEFANHAVKLWNDYFEWYKNLNDNDRQIIKASPNSFRIQQAMELAGLAYISRGDTQKFRIREMFDHYSNLPYSYVNSAAIKRWRIVLHRCPSWIAPEGSELPSFQSTTFQSTLTECSEYWHEFSDYLGEWTSRQDLSVTKRNRFQRWHGELSSALSQ